MDASPERYQTFMEKTGRLMPQEKLHRISAVDGRALPGFGKPPWFAPRTRDRARFWGGTAGCALSHRKCLEFARAHGWKNVLVLEDDAELLDTPDGPEMLLSFLRNQGDRDMLYLGFIKPPRWGRRLRSGSGCNVWQVDGVISTFAYLFPAGLYDEALGMMPTEGDIWEWLSIYRAIDVFYRDFLPMRPGVRIHVLHPVLFGHCEGVSVIGGTPDDCDIGCRESPAPLSSLHGLWNYLMTPFHRLKIRLNSMRTHCRALHGGLPGRRKQARNK